MYSTNLATDVYKIGTFKVVTKTTMLHNPYGSSTELIDDQTGISIRSSFDLDNRTIIEKLPYCDININIDEYKRRMKKS